MDKSPLVKNSPNPIKSLKKLLHDTETLKEEVVGHITTLEHSGHDRVMSVEEMEVMSRPLEDEEAEDHGNPFEANIPPELDAAYELLGFSNEEDGNPKAVVTEK
ncbi:hypothetical protein SUGI_1067490 [Cryptomeria japonica]|nr:hypothetical protein SUGI_1067490 [Cryptomeria japonica]